MLISKLHHVYKNANANINIYKQLQKDLETKMATNYYLYGILLERNLETQDESYVIPDS